MDVNTKFLMLVRPYEVLVFTPPPLVFSRIQGEHFTHAEFKELSVHYIISQKSLQQKTTPVAWINVQCSWVKQENGDLQYSYYCKLYSLKLINQ